MKSPFTCIRMQMLYVCNMAQRVKLFKLLLLFFFYEQVLLNSVADGFINAKGINSACVRKQIIVDFLFFFSVVPPNLCIIQLKEAKLVW